MHVTRHAISVTTAADGSATVYSPQVTGRVLAIHYVKNNFADTVDFAITAEATGETIWNEANVTASKACAPRMATHSTAGVAALYASGGLAVNDCIAVAQDRIKFTITNGGNATNGAFHLIIG